MICANSEKIPITSNIQSVENFGGFWNLEIEVLGS